MPGNYVRVGVGTTGVGKAGSELDKLRDKAERLQKQGVKGLGIGAGIGAFNAGVGILTTGLDRVTDFVSDSTEAASDLNEEVSKSEVIFGDAAEDIEKWSTTASRSFGQSKKDALSAASTFAGLFDTVGVEMDKATDMSKKLTVLGSDLASFFNSDVGDALQALRSGLSGESEPMRRFNVFLNESAVKAKAAELGLVGAHGELSDGQKILARYNLILDQTAKAQGDFARTADGMANAERTKNAILDDSQALLGQRFLPIAKQVTAWQVDFIEGLYLAGDGLGAALGGVNDLVGGLGDLLQPWEMNRAMMNQASNAAIDYAKTSEGMAEDAREAGRIAATAPKAVEEATGRMADAAEDDAETVVESFEDMVDGMVDAYQRSVDEFFDPLETRAEIHAARVENHEATERREKAKTAKEKREAAEDIISSLDDEGSALDDLAERGKLTAKDVDKFEKDVVASYKAMGKKVPPELQKIIDKARVLASIDHVNIKVSVGDLEKANAAKPRGGHRAAGGPVSAGTPYVVGEEGPELFVPGASGGIVPNDRLASQAVGDSWNVVFNVAGRMDEQDVLAAVSRLRNISRYRKSTWADVQRG